MPEKQLLPLSVVLDHDGHELKIIRLLNAGLTGEVYEGTLALADIGTPIRVAVKVMKALEFPMARIRFLQESESLAFLMPLEEEANKEQLLSLKVAPNYYGRGEYEGSPYLVMEFVDGKDIPSILEKEGRLPEKQALVIAWHLYRTLDILHTRLKRTYIDLKFDDLWWVNKPEEQLKLLDFGTLEDIKPTDVQLRGVRRDLLLGGVYLFALLTGRMISYSLGELGERVDPLIRQHEANVSWGTRQLLRRLLHRNPSNRPTSAAAIAADLRTLVNFWNQPEDRLYSMIQNNLAEAETEADQVRAKNQPLSKQGRDCATRARSALDTFHALYPGRDISADIQRAEKALSIGDYLERGTALLKGRSFETARKVFEEGVQWSEDPAQLRRWAFLAHVGEGISPSTFEKRTEEAIQVLNAMGSSHWAIALERLEKLEKTGMDGVPGFESEGLNYLITEATFFSGLEQAEAAQSAGEYKKAASIYRSMQAELNKLPEVDARFITDEEVGDLSLLVENMTVLAATRELAAKNYQAACQSLEKNDWDKCVQLASEAYFADRTAPFRNKELNQIARLALERASKDQGVFASAIRAARQVSGIGVWETPMDLALAGTWHLASDFDNAEIALEIRGGAGLQQAVTQAYADAASDGLLQPLTTTLLARAEKFAESSPALLHSLANICKENLGNEAASNTLLERAGQMENKQRLERQAEVDRRLDQISFILAPISPEPGRMASILEQAANAASIWRGIDIAVFQDRQGRLEDVSTRLDEIRRLAEADNYRLEEIAHLRSLVDKGLDATRVSLTGQEKARRDLRENQIAALSMERREIDSLRQWSRQAINQQVNLDAQRSVQLQLRDKLVDFFYRCYQVLAGEKGAQAQAAIRQEEMNRLGTSWEKIDEIGAVRIFAEWATHSLDELGEEAWQEVRQVAEQHQKQVQAGLEPAKAAFVAGDLVRLSAELDRIEPEFGSNLEWQKLKKDLVIVSAWKAWTESRADVLGKGQPDLELFRDLRDYLRADLPEHFWNQAGLPAYLKKSREIAKQEASQLLKRKDDESKDSEVVEALVQWLSVEWTSRMANSTSQSAHKWNRLEWLHSVYRNPNLEQSPAALPEDVELTLRSFSTADWQAVRKAEKKAQADRIRAQKTVRRAMIIIPSVLVIVALLGFAGNYIYRANQARIDQMLHGTYTPTITNTPTETLVPTETPTLTSTPTETLTPTPITPSSFIAPSVIYPPLSVSGDAAWLLNLDQRADPTFDQVIQALPAFTDQDVWARDNSADPKADRDIHFYTTKGNVTVSWQMDQPFETGTYAVYVIDTTTHSVGTYTYSMMLDSVIQTPVRGQNSVNFQGDGQKTDEWLPAGFYKVQSGQKMSVRVTVGELTIDAPFAVDRLLIIKLSEAQLLMLDGLPVNRTLVSLLDDDRAIFYELNDEGTPVQVLDRGTQFTDAPAWNNSFASRDLTNPLAVPLWIDWQSLGRIPAGTYELYVWIPALHASVQANYALLVDGKPIQFEGSEVRLDTGTEAYLRPLNQNDHSNVWYSLGTWTLQTEGSVGLRMIVPENTAGAVGVDVSALVKVGE